MSNGSASPKSLFTKLMATIVLIALILATGLFARFFYLMSLSETYRIGPRLVRITSAHETTVGHDSVHVRYPDGRAFRVSVVANGYLIQLADRKPIEIVSDDDLRIVNHTAYTHGRAIDLQR